MTDKEFNSYPPELQSAIVQMAKLAIDNYKPISQEEAISEGYEIRVCPICNQMMGYVKNGDRCQFCGSEVEFKEMGA